MTYTVKIVDNDTWSLIAPDGSVLSQDNQLPVQTPDDIADDIAAHAGSLLPIYKTEYEVVDNR